MIGIIGAMKVEVDGLKALMTEKKESVISQISFLQGRLMGKECVVAQCGIGKVNAAICAQTMILTYRPACIINLGVAGAMGKGIHIGDVVIAHNVIQHDVDTTAVGDERGFLSGLNVVRIPCEEKLNKALERAGNEAGLCVHRGTILTGDQFIADKQKLNQLMEDFGGVACEMEGGSIGQVCMVNKVPFSIVRAISDQANDDAHVDYPQFVKTAAAQSICLVKEFLKNIQ